MTAGLTPNSFPSCVFTWATPNPVGNTSTYLPLSESRSVVCAVLLDDEVGSNGVFLTPKQYATDMSVRHPPLGSSAH